MDLFKSTTAAEYSCSSSFPAALQPGPGLAATDSMREHTTSECESDVQQHLGERANGGRSEASDESEGEDWVGEAEQPAKFVVCSPPSFLFFSFSAFNVFWHACDSTVHPPSTLPCSPSRHFMQVDFEDVLMPSVKRANRHEVISRMCQKNRWLNRIQFI